MKIRGEDGGGGGVEENKNEISIFVLGLGIQIVTTEIYIYIFIAFGELICQPLRFDEIAQFYQCIENKIKAKKNINVLCLLEGTNTFSYSSIFCSLLFYLILQDNKSEHLLLL